MKLTAETDWESWMAANLFHRMIMGAMQTAPRWLIWQFSRRYIAGTRLEDAFSAVRSLNDAGCCATIDVLGEDSVRADQVNDARDLYLRALDGIRDAKLDCNISIKLSEMGLRFDPDHCRQVVHELLVSAAEHGNFVRIDMEDSTATDVTLQIYREFRERFDNVGIVIQSCLRRSEHDVDMLLRTGPTHVRLCKGIYIEPLEISHRDPEEIRISFRALLEQLLAGGATKVGIATHDPALVEHAEEVISKLNVPRDRYEFQMLLGVASRLRQRLVETGHPLRVYVPFGELWFNYSMRRLRENPDILGHIIRNMFTFK